MASQTMKIVGCSGCVIEAIERQNEQRLRELLSAANVEYSDTHWVSVFQIKLMASYPNRFRCFPMKSSTCSLTSEQQCDHPIVEETLVPGEPANIAMSVVLSSMLHTTAEFNAFEMVVESHKFDMSEPLIFHLTWYTELSLDHWSFFIVDAAGMALLLDKGTDLDDANSFLLLKTCASLLCANSGRGPAGD